MSVQLEVAARVGEMNELVHRTLEPLIDRSLPVALIDFPRYANVGDSAIWAGEIRFLESMGIRPKYTCDIKTYTPRTLAGHIGRGTILLTGGGNFIDLYPRHQRLREHVIESFPDNPIIQLPQSIHFEKREALERARSVYDRHRNLTLLLRDGRSLETVRANFRTRSRLCPDMAFCLGSLDRPVEPSSPVVWLMRDDEEAIPTLAEGAPQIDRYDWRYEPRMFAFRLYIAAAGATYRSRAAGRALRRLVVATQTHVAMRRVTRGSAMLARGRLVITDRLHGHIVCLLMGIPHVLLDNSYGKNRDFLETWTAGWGITRWADSAGEARALAASFAQDGWARDAEPARAPVPTEG